MKRKEEGEEWDWVDEMEIDALEKAKEKQQSLEKEKERRKKGTRGKGGGKLRRV